MPDSSNFTDKPPHVLMIFIDGLGIGSPLPELNPLALYPDVWPSQGREPSRTGLKHTSQDACLGVEGLPQSATGQTALLTGVNAPKIIGRHVQGFPSRRLIEILREHSIFVKLAACGKTATFANAYRDPESSAIETRLSVTSHALKASGQPFRGLNLLWREEALTHDFTNQHLIAKGYQAPVFSPEQAARILINLAIHHDFTLYEHFLTDLIAHRGTAQEIAHHVLLVTTFIRACLEEASTAGVFLIITSDHGNIEDSTLRTHTRNPVPLIWQSPDGVIIPPLPESITGVSPWILRLLSCQPS